jgi:hypothetical protein
VEIHVGIHFLDGWNLDDGESCYIHRRFLLDQKYFPTDFIFNLIIFDHIDNSTHLRFLRIYMFKITWPNHNRWNASSLQNFLM